MLKKLYISRSANQGDIMINKLREILIPPKTLKNFELVTQIREMLEYIFVASSPLLLFVLIFALEPSQSIPKHAIGASMFLTIFTLAIASSKMNRHEGASKTKKIMGFLIESLVLLSALMFNDLHNDRYFIEIVAITLFLFLALYLIEFGILLSNLALHLSNKLLKIRTKDNADE